MHDSIKRLHSYATREYSALIPASAITSTVEEALQLMNEKKVTVQTCSLIVMALSKQRITVGSGQLPIALVSRILAAIFLYEDQLNAQGVAILMRGLSLMHVKSYFLSPIEQRQLLSLVVKKSAEFNTENTVSILAALFYTEFGWHGLDSKLQNAIFAAIYRNIDAFKPAEMRQLYDFMQKLCIIDATDVHVSNRADYIKVITSVCLSRRIENNGRPLTPAFLRYTEEDIARLVEEANASVITRLSISELVQSAAASVRKRGLGSLHSDKRARLV